MSFTHFLLFSDPPKRSRVKRYQTLTLSVLLVSQASYQVEIPQVSMAALKEPPSFKVVKLVDRNAASRSGQSAERGSGGGEEEKILTVHVLWIRKLGAGPGCKHSSDFACRLRVTSAVMTQCLTPRSPGAFGGVCLLWKHLLLGQKACLEAQS